MPSLTNPYEYAKDIDPATFFLPGADRAEFLIEFGLTPLVGLGVRRYESTGT